jgi:hypothetical protein
MSCFHSYFDCHCSQFLTRRHFNGVPRSSPYFNFMFISFDMATSQVFILCDSRTWVAFCTQGGLEFNMELASAVGVVCPLHLCSVRTSPFAGWHRLPLAPVDVEESYIKSILHVIQICAVPEKVITSVFTIIIAIHCIIYRNTLLFQPVLFF